MKSDIWAAGVVMYVPLPGHMREGGREGERERKRERERASGSCVILVPFVRYYLVCLKFPFKLTHGDVDYDQIREILHQVNR